MSPRNSLSLTVSFLLLVSNVSVAKDYYVATTGNDNFPGTQSQPFRSISCGLRNARQPGDAVILRKGTYPQSRSINLIFSGRPGKLITLRAFPGEEVIIDGRQTPPDTSLINVLAHHVQIQGLTVRNASKNGICLWGPGSRIHDVNVIGNQIQNCQYSSIYAGFNSLEDPVRDLLFENNIVSHCVLMNAGNQHTSWSFGLGAGLSKNITIRNNRVSRCFGEGIGLYLSDKGVIEGNTVSDNFSVNVYLDNTTNTLVSRNLVYSTKDKKFYRFDHPASGIQIANENYRGYSNPSSNNTIIGNILIDNHFAIYSGSYQRGGGLKQTLIAHNTAYGSTGPLLMIDADNGHQQSRIINNIFQQTGRAPLTSIQEPLAQIEFHHNLWYGGTPQQGVRGAGDLLANPLFKNPGGYSMDDYQLRLTSPARNTGVRLDELKPYLGNQKQNTTVNLGAQ
ncbi:hypothetical protein Pan241w_19470 [Gimesia alba]|uniref:Right handed beta helix domain-containing protein n=1 Tax=Gimesia alba TaxID=2527973 RepID=A0A517RDC8_9PLAN|nr:right-handed parallel beta-helix repeat-containing protein [Gimesia alba]QDT41879.1 hypothetical protein Pan241w_19470 [Gimesia alba]